ncbi:MAG: FixH family protein [Flavobacteriia bacterium]|jgi:hypothetical protein
MNWGKGLTIAMISFVSFITVLIVIIMSNRIDLVSEDYYQKEVVFGDQISAQNNWNEVAENVQFQANKEHLIVNLPKIEGVDNYQLKLKRPNDNKQDLAFEINNTQTYLIEKSKLHVGVYDYTLECKKGGKTLLNTGQYYVK